MPLTENKLNHCSKCFNNFNKNYEGVNLDCNHQLHYKCLNELARESCGEFIDFIEIKKSKIIEGIEDNFENSMIFGQNNSGIIFCPECKLCYSLFSYVYRKYQIPKLIGKMILIFDETNNEKYYNYHICTNIDIVHLLQLNEQSIIFKEFEMDLEENYITDETYSKHDYLSGLLDPSENILHAVVEFSNEKGKKLLLVDNNKCPVCNCDCDSVSSVDTNDMIMVRHCTIDEFINLLYYNKNTL